MVVFKPAGEDKFGPYLKLDCVLRGEANTIGCNGRHFMTGTSANGAIPNACFASNCEWYVMI